MSHPRTIAVMQPYLFPYVGYFQLIRAADTFVFYDDVAFIKRGWINRNRILGSSGQPQTFTVSLEGGQSQTRTIAQTPLSATLDWRRKFERGLMQTYAKAPFRDAVIGLVHTVFDRPAHSIADLACHSVEAACAHINLERDFVRSSVLAPETATLDRTERLIALTRQLGGARYLNADGGRALYEATPFAAAGLELRFLEPTITPYAQGGQTAFVPGLSILDLLMWNGPGTVRKMVDAGRVTP